MLVFGAKGKPCFDVAEPSPLEGYRHKGNVLTVDVSRDGTLVLSGGSDAAVVLYVWDASRSGAAECKKLLAHSGPVTSVALSGDGTRAVSASADTTTAMVWDLRVGAPVTRLSLSASVTAGVTFRCVRLDPAPCICSCRVGIQCGQGGMPP